MPTADTYGVGTRGGYRHTDAEVFSMGGPRSLQCPRDFAPPGRFGGRDGYPHGGANGVTPSHSRARSPGDTFRFSDSQIFSASLMPHRRCDVHEKGFGCLVEELKVGGPPIQLGAPIAVIRGGRRVRRIRALISH